jgi:hypothetical protein
MNVDLLMGEELKKSGAGNLFTVFGEPDIELRHTDDGQVVSACGSQSDRVRIVENIRIESVDEPLAADGHATLAAVRLVTRGAVMGFLPTDTDTRRLDLPLINRVLSGLAAHGVGVALAASPQVAVGSALEDALQRALDQSEHSPMPSGEWPSLLATLGEDLLAGLLDVSASSIRRYAAGTRATPQEVADRLHVLALIVADLAGGYNEYGIRRWFTRPRPQLDGTSPLQFLGSDWNPDGEAAARVRDLAAALVGAGAT